MKEVCKYCGLIVTLNEPTKHMNTFRTRKVTKSKMIKRKIINPDGKKEIVMERINYCTDEYIFKDGINNYHARCDCGKMVFHIPGHESKIHPIHWWLKLMDEVDPVYHLQEKRDDGTIMIRPSTMLFEFGYHWPGNYGKNWPFALGSDYEDIRDIGQLTLLF